MDSFSDEYETPDPISVWKENHGNWLLGLVVVIVLVGSVAMALAGRKSPDDTNTNSVSTTGQSPSIAQDATEADGLLLTVVVQGATSDEGSIMLAIYDSTNQLTDPSHAFMKASREIHDGTAKWVIAAKTLPLRFAIAAFHDKNDDGLLNRSAFGIPSEPFGFSIQTEDHQGPPSFDQAVRDRPGKDQTIEIFLDANTQDGD